MTAPEVQFVLDAVKDHYGVSPLSDIPLERIDRDNSDILEGPTHQHSADLQGMNYVGAGLASRDTEPIGTEYDHELQTVVGVRIEGAHVSEFGAIDPGTTSATVSSPTTTWDTLTTTIRRAVLTDRTFPSVGRPNVTYKDLKLANETDVSDEYSDYYRYDFDVLFLGFEELP